MLKKITTLFCILIIALISFNVQAQRQNAFEVNVGGNVINQSYGASLSLEGKKYLEGRRRGFGGVYGFTYGFGTFSYHKALFRYHGTLFSKPNARKSADSGVLFYYAGIGGYMRTAPRMAFLPGVEPGVQMRFKMQKDLMINVSLGIDWVLDITSSNYREFYSYLSVGFCFLSKSMPVQKFKN